MSDGKMVHVHLLDQANERALLLERELAQIKQGWAEDDARLLRAEEGWAEASERLAQVKAERDEAVRRWAAEVNEQTGVIFELRADCAAFKKLLDDVAAVNAEMRAERDTAIRRLEAVLEWSNTERFAGRTRHEDDAPSLARAFLLSMQDGSNP